METPRSVLQARLRDWRRRCGLGAGLVLLLALGFTAGGIGVAPSVGALSAAPPDPTYATAVVDGNPGEWNTSTDFFSAMYLAGNASKGVLANGYLRYDCNTHVVYVLVLQKGYGTGSATPLLSPAGNAWATINGASQKSYTDSSGNNGTPPDFAWIGVGYSGADPTYAQGYEASFSLAPGSYTIIVHVEALDTSSNEATAAFLGFGAHPASTTSLHLSCPSTTTTTTTATTDTGTTETTSTDTTTTDTGTTDSTSTDTTTTETTDTGTTETTDTGTTETTDTGTTETTDTGTTETTDTGTTETTDTGTTETTDTGTTETTDTGTTETTDTGTTETTDTGTTETTDTGTTETTDTGTTETTDTGTTGTTTTGTTTTTPTTTHGTTTEPTATAGTTTAGTTMVSTTGATTTTVHNEPSRTPTNHAPGAEDLSVTNKSVDVDDPVSADFTRVFRWELHKTSTRARLTSLSRAAIFHYAVAVEELGFKDSGWQLDGDIELHNPNAFALRNVLVTDGVDNGGMCTVSRGSHLTLPANGDVHLRYHCRYASAPSAMAGLDIVTAHWDGALNKTPNSSAQSRTPFAFHGPTKSVARVVKVTDIAVGTLGKVVATIHGQHARRVFRYAHAVRTPVSGCRRYTNKASIATTKQTTKRVVTVCRSYARPARIQRGFTG